MNWQRLAAQLVRARRGARTQKQLSRALGYKSNVVFAWENGRDHPSASVFFRLLQRTGPTVRYDSFFTGPPPDLTTKKGVALFVRELLGESKVSDLAAQLGRDRHAVGRWLRGQTEIPLCELLHCVDITTLRIHDFLALFVDPAKLPEAAHEYRLLEAARTSAAEMPWSHAILHMAELPSYKRLEQHQRGWFASRLGISTQDEDACLELLLRMGQLEKEGGRYRAPRSLNVDMRRDPLATRQLASFWMKEGAERVLTPGRGRFAFNTFALSKKDLQRARELQSEYFRQLRTLVADSSPAEAVAVATFQFFPLYQEETLETAQGPEEPTSDEPSATP